MLIFPLASLSQNTVTVYADTAGDKYLKESIRILQQEINRSVRVAFNVKNESLFGGQGILFSTKNNRWPQYSKGLSKAGDESIVVRSTGNGVAIIGHSGLALRNGIFIYLEALGFRYYMPHPDWYIIPARIDFHTTVNYAGSPSFDHRRIWYGYGTVGSKFADENYRFWFMANKLGGSMDAVVGHSYDDIVARNAETFKLHPEWLYPAPPKGVIPGNPKFDLANQSLIQFVISDVLKRLEAAKIKNAPLKMITMSPSDGNGTCNTPACQQLGTITDRVYSLVNKVAKEVRLAYPGTWISGMAYSEYAEPPTAKLEPNTFVSIATAFNNSKYNTDELIQKWSYVAGKVGIYDYLGLYAWDYDLPGKGQANQIARAVTNLKKYYRLGARGYDAESTPGSINKGLGHYVIARLLWNNSDDPEKIKTEFFEKCFGKAAGLITKLWAEWESYPYTGIRESDLATWIDVVNQAALLEPAEGVGKRLMHIKVYLHYLYLYNSFKKGESEENRINLLNYSYNSFDWAAFSGYPSLWVLGNGTGISGFGFNDPRAKYKKVDSQFRKPGYINLLVAQDRKSLSVKDNVKKYGLPAQVKKVSTIPAIFTERQYESFKGTTTFSGLHTFIVEIKEAGSQNFIDLAGGYVSGNQKPITITVSAYKIPFQENQKILLKYDYNGNMDTQRISLKSLPKGDYRLVVSDPNKYFRIMFSVPILYGVIVTPESRLSAYTRYMCFNVPRGTTKFRVFKDIEIILVSPTGRKVDYSKKGTEEIDVSVLPGEEGLWMINFLSGKLHIEGVPLLMAMDPKQLLLTE